MLAMKSNLLISFLLISTALFSQTYDSKLESVYSKKELAQFSIKQIEVLNFALSEGLYFTTSNSKTEFSSLPSIKSLGEGKNFVDYGVKITDTNQYFSVEGSNEVMVVKSWYVLENELKNKP